MNSVNMKNQPQKVKNNILTVEISRFLTERMRRFKVALMLLSGFLILTSFSADPPVKFIIWSGERLSPDDFKRHAPDRDTEKKLGASRKFMLEGFIYSGIRFSYEQSNGNLKFQVEAFMEPGQSWLRNPRDMGTLDHEQAHFDITEIYARKLRKALSNVNNAETARKIYQKNFKALQEEQQRFDKVHKGENGVDDHWKKEIEEQLEKYAAWAEPVLFVNAR